MSISFDLAIIFLGVSRSGLNILVGTVARRGDGCGGGGGALLGVEVVDIESEENEENGMILVGDVSHHAVTATCSCFGSNLLL